MGGAEGVVDVDVGERGELLGELGIADEEIDSLLSDGIVAAEQL